MPVWELYTYGNGEFLRWLFNGIVAVMGQGGYANVMRITVYASLAYVLIRMAFFKGVMDWSWLVGFVLMYNLLFVPKVNIVIVDRLDPNQSGTVIRNVPWGLGVFASTINQIGDKMTEWAEAVNSLPDDLRYQKNGVVFGAKLIEAASTFEITTPNLQANMAEFMQQCVFYDILLRNYTMDELMSTDDIWDFLKGKISKARSFRYNDNIIVCKDGIPLLSKDWDDEVQNAAGLYGMRFFPGLNMAEARAKMLSALPVSYDFIANISKSGGDIIRQHMMINLFRRSLNQAASSTNASAAMQDFAYAQAEQQHRTAYQTMGAMAAKLLPLLKNVFEGLLYGIFPFLFLMFLMPVGAKTLILYIQNLAWLQFWAPLYSILNLLMTLSAARHGAASVMDAGGNAVLTLQTASGLSSVTADTAILAGYMGMSIPLIAYGLVSGGKFAFAQLASQVGAVAQTSAVSTSSQVATGNISLANMGMYSTGMFQNNTAPNMNYGTAQMTDAATGVQSTITGSGTFYSVPQHNTGISINSSESIKGAMQHQYSSMQSSAQNELMEYSVAAGTSYQSMNQLRESISNQRGAGVDFSSREVSSFQQSSGELKRIVDNFSTSENMSDQEKFTLLASADASLKAYGGVEAAARFGTPKVLSAIAGTDVGVTGKMGAGLEVGVKGSARGESAEVSNEQWQSALQYAQDTNFGEVYQRTMEAGQSSIASARTALGADFSDGSSDSFNKAIQERDQAVASISAVKQYQESMSKVEESGVSSNIDLTGMVFSRLQEAGMPATKIMADASHGDARSMDILNKYTSQISSEIAQDIGGGISSQGVQSHWNTASGEILQTHTSKDLIQAWELGPTAERRAETDLRLNKDLFEEGYTQQVNMASANMGDYSKGIEGSGVDLQNRGKEIQQQVEKSIDNKESISDSMKNIESGGLESISSMPSTDFATEGEGKVSSADDLNLLGKQSMPNMDTFSSHGGRGENIQQKSATRSESNSDQELED